MIINILKRWICNHNWVMDIEQGNLELYERVTCSLCRKSDTRLTQKGEFQWGHRQQIHTMHKLIELSNVLKK